MTTTTRASTTNTINLREDVEKDMTTTIRISTTPINHMEIKLYLQHALAGCLAL